MTIRIHTRAERSRRSSTPSLHIALSASCSCARTASTTSALPHRSWAAPATSSSQRATAPMTARATGRPVPWPPARAGLPQRALDRMPPWCVRGSRVWARLPRQASPHRTAKPTLSTRRPCCAAVGRHDHTAYVPPSEDAEQQALAIGGPSARPGNWKVSVGTSVGTSSDETTTSRAGGWNPVGQPMTGPRPFDDRQQFRSRPTGSGMSRRRPRARDGKRAGDRRDMTGGSSGGPPSSSHRLRRRAPSMALSRTAQTGSRRACTDRTFDANTNSLRCAAGTGQRKRAPTC